MPGAEIPFPNPVYGSDALRRIETAAAALTTTPLMQLAGSAGADMARSLLGPDGTSVLIVAGPGNNGGDALVVAERLRQEFFRVDLVFRGDADGLPRDARDAWDTWRAGGGTCYSEIPQSGRWDLVVDGLFGTGLSRPVAGEDAALIEQINRLNAPILSLDVPSGLCADSGEVLGCAVRASHTLTFLALKPGLLTGDGPDYCGAITLDTLGIDTPMIEPPGGWLLEQALVAKLLPRRALNSHKGSFGSVGVVGGAAGRVGAALLAARAALRLGAGRVYLGLLDEHALAVDVMQPELMPRAAALLDLPNCTTLVTGPGLGQSPSALARLIDAIEAERPLVLDADALNLLASDPELQERVAKRSAPTVLTPHPLEAARLIGATLDDVRYQRIDVAVMLATRLNAFTVLKGVGSIVAQPNGAWYVNPSGNPGLASAGTGDVLAGMLGALLAQGMAVRDATLLATHLHGAAADALVAQGAGPVGLTASELIDAARALLNRWVYG